MYPCGRPRREAERNTKCDGYNRVLLEHETVLRNRAIGAQEKRVFDDIHFLLSI